MPRILILVPTPFELRLVLSLLQDHDCADGELQSPLLCGFGPIASAARTAGLIAERQPDRVLLIGIAGTYDPEKLPVGRASQFSEVACHGIGVGSGPSFLSASKMGWSQFSRAPFGGTQFGGTQFAGTQFGGTQRLGIDVEPELGDQIALQSIGVPDVCSAGLLLTCCAASANESEALERRQRYPTAMAEDMEGFGVAMACAMTGVPLSIVRGISNRVGDRDRNNWQFEPAIAAAVELAVNLVEQVRGGDRE